MSSSHSKEGVALGSVFSSAFLTMLKFVVGVMTGSLGIISEALHSLMDFGAALITYFAVRVGDKPPDDHHHYGHAKVESVAALIATALLFLTSFWIIYEAAQRLFVSEVEVDATWYAFLVVGVSVVVDIVRARSLTRVAKATHSQALEADALHFSSDIWSSLAVGLGLVGVYFGVPFVDSVAALVVAAVVMFTGYKLGRRTIDELVDMAPSGVAEVVVEAAAGVEGVFGVAKVKVRSVGPKILVEVLVEVERKLAFGRVKSILLEVEKSVEKRVERAEVTARAVPVALSSETMVERVQIIASNQGHFVHDVVVHRVQDKHYVSFDLEVDVNLTLAKAHEAATDLENVLIGELGKNIVVNTHIEPLKMSEMAGVKAGDKEIEQVKTALKEIVEELELIERPHSVEVRKIEGRLFVSLHAYAPGEAALDLAHNESSRLEYLLRRKVPVVARAVVHLEPI